MITLTNLSETDYFLPDDGKQAQETFLSLLLSPGETYISAYGFTLEPMFQEILKADAAGVVVHILLDHTQASGHAEAPKVKALAQALQHGDLTITTAGCGSGAPSQIYHSKAMVVAATDGGESHCWEGSVNFSQSGWLQANTARTFRSDAWASEFIARFKAHREWALENESRYQIQKATAS